MLRTCGYAIQQHQEEGHEIQEEGLEQKALSEVY